MFKRVVFYFTLSLILFAYACSHKEKRAVNVITPVPKNIEYRSGNFTINKDTRIVISNDSGIVAVAEYLKDRIKEISGNDLIIITREDKKRNFISIKGSVDSIAPEGYNLNVSKRNIEIKANNAAGAFYAIQTMFQLMPPEEIAKSNSNTISVSAAKIFDKPDFKWRGMHLDVCRHFYSVEFVKKYIDLLAMHKMNVFHWHLTEDQGWRIQIDKYPKLTEVGAWRTEKDGSLHGGFYTKEQIKEVVAYAKDRHITVVPEIEMPGHSLAALAAYPEYSCTKKGFSVTNQWGIFEDIYCAGNDKTLEFLKDILVEVMELFPSEYIHIGGDEAPKARWKKCPLCQKRIRDNKLKDEYELQSWFIQQIDKFLTERGRKLIGWDEILEGGLSPNATVMSWRGEAGGIEAANDNHYVVMSPNKPCYFDHYQWIPEAEPKAIGGYTTLKDVFNYSPVPAKLPADKHKYVLGAQGNVWTEYMGTEDHVEYMVIPRITALAEVLWGKRDNDWNSFMKRLQVQIKRFDALDYNYHLPVPKSKISNILFTDTVTVSLSLPYDFAKIYYTLDDSEPTDKSLLYNGAIKMKKGDVLKAFTWVSKNKRSPYTVINARSIDKIEPVKIGGLKRGIRADVINGSFNKCSQVKGDIISSTTQNDFDVDNIGPKHLFGAIFNGYIRISKDDNYLFELGSDDGSVLYIGDIKVVDNDGKHSFRKRQGVISLSEGYYPIKVKYLQGYGRKKLQLKVGTNESWLDLKDMLYYKD
ncbi:MAG: family 20 glycosylhydrolase [Bacteroidales bacterium]|jgi:hexosaminidase|nr:family 20 glycosylhydrolase [Bacteroidales bacterium]